MADQPETTTATETQEEVIQDDFENSFAQIEQEQNTPVEEGKEEAFKPESDDQPEEEVKTEQKTEAKETTPVTEPEVLEQLLNTEFKRHETTKSLRDWIKENPELTQEVLGQTIDWGAGKAESKKLESETKAYLLKETETLQSQRKGLDTILLQNLAYEVDLPIRTFADFENDINVNDPEEEYAAYEKSFKDKASIVAENRAYANMKNDKIFSEFAKQYPDADLNELATQMQSYLDYSVSKGQKPLPEDTIEVYYRGKNHERLVKEAVGKAVKSEREKMMKQFAKTGQPTQTSDREKQNDVVEDDFDRSFQMLHANTFK